ncbi:MAG: hypothetical protein ABI635_01465, partial [Actinomycetota bacterium]
MLLKQAARRLSLARGGMDQALEATDRELDLARGIGDPQILLVALGTRVKCLREAGRLSETTSLLEEVLAAWRASDVLSGMAAALDVAWTLGELRREPEMLQLLDARGWHSRWFEAAERALRGDLTGAADICSRIGSAPEEAEARLHAAEDLASDDPRRTELARGVLEFYRRVHATALVRRTEALLATGTRHRAGPQDRGPARDAHPRRGHRPPMARASRTRWGSARRDVRLAEAALLAGRRLGQPSTEILDVPGLTAVFDDLADAFELRAEGGSLI